LKGSSLGRGDLEGRIASLSAEETTSMNSFGFVSNGLQSGTFLFSSITSILVIITSFGFSIDLGSSLLIISKPFSSIVLYSRSAIEII
jgi:hypothetical protein